MSTIKHLNKIAGVRKIEVKDQYLIVLFVNKSIAVYDLSGENSFLEKEFHSSSMYLVGSEVYSARNSVLELEDLKMHHIAQLEGAYFSGVHNQELFLFTTADSYKVCTLGKSVQILHSYLINETRSIVYLDFDGTIWLLDHGLKCHRHGGDVVWEKRFADMMRTNHAILNSPVQFNGGKLFFTLKDSITSKSSFFLLEARSGRELFVEQEFGGFIRNFKNYLYRLHEKQVATFDLETLGWTYFDKNRALSILDKQKEEFASTGEYVGATLQGFSLSPICYDVEQNELFFTQERGSQIGVLDLTADLLLWNFDVK